MDYLLLLHVKGLAMQSRLFEVDPLAAINYGLYNALKKGEGSFEDFLVNYDSYSVNDGDNSWLSNLVNQDTYESITSPEVLGAMDALGLDNLNFLTKKGNYFDTQVAAYKLQLLQEMSKRGEKPSSVINQFYQNLDTMTL